MQFVNNYHVLHAARRVHGRPGPRADPPPQAALARDRRAHRRRQARGLPPRPHRRLLGAQRPHQVRDPGLTRGPASLPRRPDGVDLLIAACPASETIDGGRGACPDRRGTAATIEHDRQARGPSSLDRERGPAGPGLHGRCGRTDRRPTSLLRSQIRADGSPWVAVGAPRSPATTCGPHEVDVSPGRRDAVRPRPTRPPPHDVSRWDHPRKQSGNI